MAIQLQLRRGSEIENNSFTGALGEATVDTTNNILRVHDGSTAGGFSLVGINAAQTLTNKTYSSGTLSGSFAGNASYTGLINFTSVTDSSSTSTGAIVVAGGVGIAKNVYVGEDIVVSGNVSALNFNSTSDIKFKENIKTIEDPINKVNELRGVNFTWKSNNEFSMGVVAQEVENVIPEVVSVNKDGNKSVNYDGMVGLLIEAVKKQQLEIENLKQKINNL